jgi:DNA-binding NarL/FixJ family response regulator
MADPTNMTEPIRVLCVEDDEATATFYRVALGFEPDLECVATLPGAERLAEEVERLRPDVVVLDLGIPGPDPLEVLSEVAARHPQVGVLVASGYDDPETIDQAFARGARGFAVKTSDLHDMIDAIRRVGRGERVRLGR